MYCQLLIAKPGRKYQPANIEGLLYIEKHPPMVEIVDPVSEATLWIQIFPNDNLMEFKVVKDCLMFDGYDECFCIQFTNDFDSLIVQKSYVDYYKLFLKEQEVVEDDEDEEDQPVQQEVFESFKTDDTEQRRRFTLKELFRKRK